LGTPRQFIVVLLIVGACGFLVVSPAMGKLAFLAQFALADELLEK